jgi:hypothetical protein
VVLPLVTEWVTHNNPKIVPEIPMERGPTTCNRRSPITIPECCLAERGPTTCNLIGHPQDGPRERGPTTCNRRSPQGQENVVLPLVIEDHLLLL